MSSERRTVRDWLEQFARRRSWLATAGSVAAFLGGALVLFITWWVIWYVLLISFGVLFNLSSTTHQIATWIVLGLLFVAYARADWGHLENLKLDGGPQAVAALVVSRVTGYGLLALAAGPNTAHSFVKVLAVTLLAGPGLWDASRRLALLARRLRRMDVDACARILTALLKAGGKLTVAELLKTSRGETELRESLQQLSDVEGVVFLPSAPAGITLTETLCVEIAEWRRAGEAA